MMHLFRLFLAALLLIGPASAQDFVLNGQGANGFYQIYRVTKDGGFTAPTLVVSPSGSGFDSSNVYWPSAVQVGGTTYLYASGSDASGNLSLGLWISNGGAFQRVGQVLTAEGDEGRIGSTHVVYDPFDHVAPFKMWFGTNYGQRATAIKYATSQDGVNWTRRSVVLQASEAYETGGFQLDYVCRDLATWRLFYSATSDPANRFVAVEAISAGPGLLFMKRGVVFEPGGTKHLVLSTVRPGSRYAMVDSTFGMIPGGVYVLTNGVVSERVVVETVMNGSEVSLEDAMVSAGENFELRSAHYRKTGISAFYRDDYGAGRVLFTGWGAAPLNALHEYVFEGKEVGGQFVIDPTAPNRFKPTGPGSLYSFENPSPIKSNPDC